MKKYFLIIISLITLNSIAQQNLKYSGFFDSYYTKGPLKYFVEPGVTMMNGELESSTLSVGIGAGVNYRILPAIYLNGSLRYMNMNSTDHDLTRKLSYNGNAFQFNAIANYHIVYDLIRKGHHRRRGIKKLNLYFSTGLSFMLMYNISTSFDGTDDFGTSHIPEYSINITEILDEYDRIIQIPIGFGVPIRVTPRFTITPEILVYYSISDKLDGITYPVTTSYDAYSFINVKFMFDPKGKRLHPKQPPATNRNEDGMSGGGDFDDSDDDFEMDNLNEKDSNNDEELNNNDDFIENEEEETNDGFEEENNEEENLEEDNNDEGDEEGDKYDEDGFLIDE